MPTLAATLRTEIRRLATAEVKKVRFRLRRIQKQVRLLGLVSRRQKQSLSSLKRKVQRLRSHLPQRRLAHPAPPGPRVAPRAILALRKRLKLSRVAFAELVGVSPGSIFGWERGRTIPRGASRARLVELQRKGARRHRGRGRGASRRRPRARG